jgi:hypothetical protein
MPSVEFSTGTRAWHAHDGRAEVAERGLFAEGAGRAEVGDAGGRLQRAAGRHDLAPDRRDALVLQRAGVAGLQAVDHLRLALGAEDDRAFVLLDLAHLQRQPGTVIEQRKQLAVEGIDLVAEFRQGGRRHGGCLVVLLFSRCSAVHCGGFANSRR